LPRHAYSRLLTLVLAAGLVLAASPPAGAVAQAPTEPRVAGHDVQLSLDPAAHRLTGRDTLTLAGKGGGRLVLVLHENLTISAASSGGRAVDVQRQDVPHVFAHGGVAAWELTLPKGAAQVVVDYGGQLNDAPKAGEGSRHGLPTQTSGLISAQGTYLPSAWAFRPWQPGERSRLALRVEAPAGYEAVSVGRMSSRETGAAHTRVVWESAEAGEDDFLLGGPLKLHEDSAAGVPVYLYFYADDADLAPAYAAKLRELVPLYVKLLGPYPYPKFAVVENFFPTGLGLPSVTLLGSQVVRLPFVLGGSLAHEFVHSWWGESVTPRGGNWAEGLTAYLSDYYLIERTGAAAAASERRRLLEQYSVYAPRLTGALAGFGEPGDRLGDVLGYTKGELVFHQLRRQVGERAFWEGLRLAARRYRFAEASWGDLARCFQKTSGCKLGWFFQQWVDRPGEPRLALYGARVERTGGGHYRVTATLSQRGAEGRLWRQRVPVVVECQNGVRLKTVIHLEGGSAQVTFTAGALPRRLVVDPEAEVLRRLGEAEIPPRLNLFFAAAARTYALPAGPLQAAARECAQALSASEPGEITEAEKLSAAAPPEAVMFLGELPAAFNRLLPEAPKPDGQGFSFRGQAYPAQASCLVVGRDAGGRLVALAYSRSAEGLAAAARFLPHLGRYQWAVFAPGQRPLKGEPEPAEWLSADLAAPPPASR